MSEAAINAQAPEERRRVLIFLDVDGVLNSFRSCIAFGSFRPADLDPIAIRLLDRLAIKLTDAGFAPEIVISSTWRTMFPRVQWWTELFARYGCIALRVVGMTEDFFDSLPQRRGREVAKWLFDHGAPETPFVCLDDDSDFLPGQPLVQTHFADGLLVEHIAEAFSVLTGAEMFDYPLPQRGRAAKPSAHRSTVKVPGSAPE